LNLADQLTRGERIRLESFAQAVNSTMVAPLPAAAHNDGGLRMAALLDRAEEIESWLLQAPEPRG